MIEITIHTTELQEILVALLGEIGYEGFHQEENALKAYIGESAFDKAALQQVLEPFHLSYEEQQLPERNYNEEWEKNFQPVIVDDFCAIRAHFHAPIPGVEHELVITPKMSFGTGHHATTHMMIQAMQKLQWNGKRVLDFGTGTGVLAILAEKLGAADILGIDNDDWSIANAQENMENNECKRITISKIDTLKAVNGKFDIILANINKHVILAELDEIGQHLGKGGVILLSGLLENDYQDIENESVKNEVSISLKMTKGAWICLQLGKARSQS